MRHWLFYILLLANVLLALYLSTFLSMGWNWNQMDKYRLDESSLQLLARLKYPVKVYAFMPDHPMERQAVREMIAPYQSHAQIELQFIEPAKQPQLSRQFNIRHTPTLILSYAGQQKRLEHLDSAAWEQALAYLSGLKKDWLINLKGHGEASLTGQANFDLSLLAKKLRPDLSILDLDLSQTGQIPRNAHLLLLAAPQTDLKKNEVQTIIDYLEKGGALLWLADGQIPQDLADYLGIQFLPGTVVDATAARLGIDQPTVAVARPTDQYWLSVIQRAVLMPKAKAMLKLKNHWSAQILLQTGAQSWNETGRLKGLIRREPQQGEQAGPLNLAYLLTKGKAKVLLVGDADFASNAFIGNLDNQSFILKAIEYLLTRPIASHVKIAPDQIIHWHQNTLVQVSLFFLFGLPILFFLIGIGLYYRRQRA